MVKTIKISDVLFDLLAEKVKESPGCRSVNHLLELRYGVPQGERKCGRKGYQKIASESGASMTGERGHYWVIDNLEVGQQVTMPWRLGDSQAALNMGIYRSQKRTGHTHLITPEHSGLTVRRMS